MLPIRQLLAAALLFGSMHCAWGAVNIRAVFDRSTIMAGETATLQVIVQGAQPQSIEDFTKIPGLSVQQRGTSQNFSMVNGVTTANFVINFSVTASQPGDYTIPGIRVVVDGATHSTEPVKLTVTKADPNVQNRYAFLKLNVPREEIYIGEVLPIDIQLYVVRAEDMQSPQLKSDGFVIHKEAQHTQSSAQVGNTPYNVLTFPKSISAAKAGQLTLGPAEMSLTLLIRGRADPNDPFGEFFGRAFQRRATTLTSNSNVLSVLPLPPNAPASFAGAIGQFNWSVEASPNTVNAGDPVTLRFTIAGEGNLDAIGLPQLDWPDFKAYQPNSTAEPADALGLRGTRKFELVVIPQHSGIKEIPALQWSFFDPKAKAYKTLSHAAMPLTVKAGTGGQATPMVLAGKAAVDEETEQRRDIVHIKPAFGQLTPMSAPLLSKPWFIVLQTIPLLAFAGLTVWRKRQDELANNPKLRRKIEVEKVVASGLKELHHLASSNSGDAFYALVFRLLQEELGERLDLPAHAITEAVLDERLPKRGASADLIGRLHQLFQVCNMARYAPVSTNRELLAIHGELASALRELQALPD